MFAGGMYFKEVIVAAVIVCNILLTYAVYLSNKKSATNRIFLLLGLVISFWLLAMYLSVNPRMDLFWTRQSAFWATLMSCFLFLLAYTLPEEEFLLDRKRSAPVFFATALIAVLTCTPYIFEKIIENGNVQKIVIGFGIIPFSALTTLFSILSLYLLFKKLHNSTDIASRQFQFVIMGFFLMLGLIIFTILIPVIFFRNNFFVQFAPIYVLLFLIMTAISIVKYHLFNIKVIATEALVVILMMLLLIEGALSGSVVTILFKVSFAILVGIIGILLVKSVRKEIKQKDELAKLADSLERANIQLQELDKQKTEFLSIASHQLRTPLSILKGYIELITDGAYGKVDKKTVKVLHDMDLNNEHLIALVDEFLNISRIEQGRAKYDFSLVNVIGIVESVVKDFKITAKEKKIKIVWEKPKNIPKVDCDQEKIHHVVFNFVDNALKYSEEGEVEVLLSQQENGIAVRVQDNGIGFNKTDQVSFYQKFFRGENVKGKNVGGTGLGLYVCRKFIEAHNGRVWAHSDGLGKGSEFGFWIPLKHVI